MDNFGKGAIVIALIIEGFIVYGGLNNPNESISNILIASLLPLALIVTVIVFWRLQRSKA